MNILEGIRTVDQLEVERRLQRAVEEPLRQIVANAGGDRSFLAPLPLATALMVRRGPAVLDRLRRAKLSVQETPVPRQPAGSRRARTGRKRRMAER